MFFDFLCRCGDITFYSAEYREDLIEEFMEEEDQ